MSKKMYKRGDVVKVWSLQSFHGGGFLNGEIAIVRQDQTGDSVMLIVTRNLVSAVKREKWKQLKFILDTSYEVYDKQVELVRKGKDKDSKDVEDFLEINNEIRTHEQHQHQGKGNYNHTPYNYAPEFHIDADYKIQLDESLLDYPEIFI